MEQFNLTTKETAERLRVSICTLANWRVSGGGPRYIKFGRKVLYPLSELEAYEKAHLRQAVSVKAGR
ncbi:MAG TPA: helix-turn-helix domain-containing protein [Geothrix sp.]|nr:helix-turn-helix domain-containing protein [Geothrix sp.]